MRFGDLLQRALFLVGVVAICLVAGAWGAWREHPFFMRHVRPAFIGATALIKQVRPSDWRDRAAREAEGAELQHDVVTPAGERVSPGLTLVVAGQSARLVDFEGRTRHLWRLGYEQLRDGKELLHEPVEQRRLYWRPARALANGDLIAVVDLAHSSPEGLAIVRMDRDSRPIWVHHGHVHHDFDVAADGRVFVLGMGMREQPPAGLDGLLGPMLEETLVILSAAGEPLQEISIVDAFAGSPYARMVARTAGTRKYEKGDYLHSNNVDVVDARVAARFPFVREGQVLLSLRELGALAVLDVERRTIVWARQDEWVQQHDPDFLENGNLLIFDNQGDYGRGGLTRVIEYEPATGAIVWQYSGGDGEKGLNSPIRGDQQRLANGNTLINDFGQSRVLEVTRAGEVVWELAGRVARPGGKTRGRGFMYAERYGPGELAFRFNEGRLQGQ